MTTVKLRTTNSTSPRHLERGAAADSHSVQLALGELWSVHGHWLIKGTLGEAGSTCLVLLLPCREKICKAPPLRATPSWLCVPGRPLFHSGFSILHYPEPGWGLRTSPACSLSCYRHGGALCAHALLLFECWLLK